MWLTIWRKTNCFVLRGIAKYWLSIFKPGEQQDTWLYRYFLIQVTVRGGFRLQFPKFKNNSWWQFVKAWNLLLYDQTVHTADRSRTIRGLKFNMRVLLSDQIVHTTDRSRTICGSKFNMCILLSDQTVHTVDRSRTIHGSKFNVYIAIWPNSTHHGSI